MEVIIYGKYLRKSTEEAERQVLSLDSQDDNITRLFGALPISEEKFRESKSAFKPHNRPDFNRLIKLIDDGEIKGILAWHPDRLARNEIEAAEITWRIRQGYIKDLKFASGFTFENTPEGIMMLQMVMSQSQYFSAKLSKDVKRGNAQKRKNGGLTGRAPEGYLNQRTSTTGRGTAIVIKDPERFPLIRKAFDLFLTGEYSAQGIHTIMSEEWGYRTLKRNKTGGGAISKASIYKIFRNVRYAGLVPDPYDPERFYKADFPAMITTDEYDKVQMLLGRDGMPRLASRKQFALRGFIRCGKCGCAITAELKRKQLKNGHVKTYTYYHCTGRKAGGCEQRGLNMREDVLYEQLLSLLDAYELHPKMLEWAMDALRDFAKGEIEECVDVQAAQRNSIVGTQNQLDKLLDMATRGLIDDVEYMTKSMLLKSELKQLQEAQANAVHRAENWHEVATQTFEKLVSAKEQFVSGDLASKKDILLAIGQNPVLLDRKLGITPNKWLNPIELTAKGVRMEIEKVRTLPQQIQKASEEAIRLQWCG